MTEVEYYGRGHRTRLRNQLVCLWGAPSPVYKGGEEGGGRPQGARPRGGLLLQVHSSRFPPFLVQLGEEGRSGKEKEGGGAAPPLVQFRLGPWGGWPLSLP